MSSKATTPEAPSLPLSPAQRLIARTLAAVGETTVAALAEAATTSKSTAAKALTKLEAVGAARRTVHQEDDVRFADTWSPTELIIEVLQATAPGAASQAHETQSLCPSAFAESTSHMASSSETAADEAVGLVGSEVLGDTNDDQPSSAHEADDAASDDTDDTDDRISETSEGVVTIADEDDLPEAVEELRHDSVLEGSITAAEPPAVLPTGRLAPGGLAAMVAAHISAHPETEFTPTELSRRLGGRSSGAIFNVLVKMQAAGTVTQTCQTPRRFRDASGTTPA